MTHQALGKQSRRWGRFRSRYFSSLMLFQGLAPACWAAVPLHSAGGNCGLPQPYPRAAPGLPPACSRRHFSKAFLLFIYPFSTLLSHVLLSLLLSFLCDAHLKRMFTETFQLIAPLSFLVLSWISPAAHSAAIE